MKSACREGTGAPSAHRAHAVGASQGLGAVADGRQPLAMQRNPYGRGLAEFARATIGVAVPIGLAVALATAPACTDPGDPDAASDEIAPGAVGQSQEASTATPRPPLASAPPADRAGFHHGEPRGWQPPTTDVRTPAVAIEDPGGEALAPFYEALATLDAALDGHDDGGAAEGPAGLARGRLVRVTHLGDSSIGMDGLPSVLRDHFQERFGDGGSGYLLLQPHSTSYRNRTVAMSTPTPWEFCYIIFQCRRDGHYGLGGVIAESTGGAKTTIRPVGGRTFTRAKLFYAGQPNGGDIGLRIGRWPEVRLDTEAPALEDRFHEERVEPGSHLVTVRAIGRSRAYGLALENEGPGLVWDTLSMIGAFTVRLLAQDPEHFERQLSARAPDLVVLSYGGNDLRRYAARAATGESIDQFRQETASLVGRVRRARPNAGCLLLGINDHERSGRQQIVPAQVQAIVDAQRAAALEGGCAFFDTVAAMGGPGSFRRWRSQDPPLAAADLKHLTHAGRQRMGGHIYDALIAGYVAHRRARIAASETPIAP